MQTATEPSLLHGSKLNFGSLLDPKKSLKGAEDIFGHFRELDFLASEKKLSADSFNV